MQNRFNGFYSCLNVYLDAPKMIYRMHTVWLCIICWSVNNIYKPVFFLHPYRVMKGKEIHCWLWVCVLFNMEPELGRSSWPLGHHVPWHEGPFLPLHDEKRRRRSDPSLLLGQAGSRVHRHWNRQGPQRLGHYFNFSLLHLGDMNI